MQELDKIGVTTWVEGMEKSTGRKAETEVAQGTHSRKKLRWRTNRGEEGYLMIVTERPERTAAIAAVATLENTPCQKQSRQGPRDGECGGSGSGVKQMTASSSSGHAISDRGAHLQKDCESIASSARPGMYNQPSQGEMLQNYENQKTVVFMDWVGMGPVLAYFIPTGPAQFIRLVLFGMGYERPWPLYSGPR